MGDIRVGDFLARKPGLESKAIGVWKLPLDAERQLPNADTAYAVLRALGSRSSTARKPSQDTACRLQRVLIIPTEASVGVEASVEPKIAEVVVWWP